MKLLLMDLDDTLIDTEPLYREALSRAADSAQVLGLTRESYLRVFEEVNNKNLEIWGVHKRRFPHSLKEAYDRMSKETNFNFYFGNYFLSLGYNIYNQKAFTFPGTEEILQKLKQKYTLCVLTKGDPKIQTKRFEDSGLSGYFDRCVVVDTKTPDTYLRLSEEYGQDPTQAAMVGNSLYGDIYPALEAGFFGIHLLNGTYNIDPSYFLPPEDLQRLYKINSLDQLEHHLETLQ